jgi:iron complex outermembrane recepter protein
MRASAWVTALSLCLVGICSAQTARASTREDTNIPPEPLGVALETLAKRYEFQVLYRTELVSSLKTAGAVGSLTPDEALTKVLSGTGLSYKYLDASTVTIVPVATLAAAGVTAGSPAPNNSGDATKEVGKKSSQDFRVGQVDQATAGAALEQGEDAAARKDQLQEVIVTAQKRSQRAIDVPASVSVIGASNITATSANSLEDLQFTVPGLTSLSYTPGGDDFVELRGVSDYVGRPTVGTYFDEMPLNLEINGFGMDVRLLDLERVEVLRGPQPTLYGDGSMGGTIRYVPAAPTLSSEASGALETDATAIQSGGSGWSAQGHVDLSLVPDRIGLRIAGSYEKDGGWIDRVPTGQTNINSNEIETIRATLLAKLTDSTQLSLLWQHGATRAPNQNFGVSDQTLLSVPSYNNTDSDLLEGVFRADLGFAELVETPDYLRFNLREQFDLTPFFLPYLPLFGIPPGYVTEIGYDLNPKANIFYNELRLVSKSVAPWSWAAGIDYKDSRYVEVTTTNTAPNTLAFQLASELNQQPTETEALWGEVGYAFTDQLHATVGARYFHDRTQYSTSSVSFGAPSPETVNIGTFTSLNPRMDISYVIRPDSNVYFSVAKGFRSGGFNAGYAPVPSYAPDDLWTEEIGSKGLYFDRRLELDAAVYYNEWNNAQDTVSLPNTLVIVTNDGRIDGAGVDLDAVLRPISGLQLGATLGWNNMAYREVPPNLSHAEGDPPDFSVRQSWSTFVDYRRPVASQTSLYGRLDFQHSNRAQVTARTPGYPATFTNIPPRSLLNAHLGLLFGRYDVALYVKNALNERNPIIQAPFGVLTEDVEQRPRLYGISLRATF